MKRRTFLNSVALSAVTLKAAPDNLPALPTDFAPCPRTLEEFLKYIVQRRAAEGLNRIVLNPADKKHGTGYGGGTEDANIAWTAAAAYR